MRRTKGLAILVISVMAAATVLATPSAAPAATPKAGSWKGKTYREAKRDVTFKVKAGKVKRWKAPNLPFFCWSGTYYLNGFVEKAKIKGNGAISGNSRVGDTTMKLRGRFTGPTKAKGTLKVNTCVTKTFHWRAKYKG
jgi:hypothetical protein